MNYTLEIFKLHQRNRLIVIYFLKIKDGGRHSFYTKSYIWYLSGTNLPVRKMPKY